MGYLEMHRMLTADEQDYYKIVIENKPVPLDCVEIDLDHRKKRLLVDALNAGDILVRSYKQEGAEAGSIIDLTKRWGEMHGIVKQRESLDAFVKHDYYADSPLLLSIYSLGMELYRSPDEHVHLNNLSHGIKPEQDFEDITPRGLFFRILSFTPDRIDKRRIPVGL